MSDSNKYHLIKLNSPRIWRELDRLIKENDGELDFHKALDIIDKGLTVMYDEGYTDGYDYGYDIGYEDCKEVSQEDE